MLFWTCVFFISCFIVFYNYIGYAALIFMINKLKSGEKTFQDDFFPSVSFIVAAFNEEDCIRKKIENSLHQDYPKEKIEFIFITDGSTDRTPEIIRGYDSVILMHSPLRRGKSSAVNRAVLSASNEIVIFSDANTFLNSTASRRLTRHYIDKTVGGVAGEKKVIRPGNNENDVGIGEGLYWKYESFLKKIDSDFHSVVGAAGELFSLRKSLFEPVSDEVILDDFVISMKVAEKGYRIVYEPEAIAMELPSFSMNDEHKRKVRISAGGFQAIGILRSLFKFWKQPKLSFLYISHRILRWTITPLCIFIAFISNAVLLYISANPLFTVLFILQVLFYGMAFLGRMETFSHYRLFKLAYYFVFMNFSVIQGFKRYIKGSQSSAWEKAKRSVQVIDAKQLF